MKKLIGTNYKSTSGFTLVELLAVISILVILSGMIVGILYSVLRGSSKTTITTDLAQNGSYALSIIANSVIDSNDVLNVKKASDGTLETDCTKNPSGPAISLKRSDGGTTTFVCEQIGGIDSISSTSGALKVSLVDTTRVKIDSSNCSFSCSQKNGNSYSTPIVGVSFTLKDLNAGLFEGQSFSVFKTSVSLRDYNP